jgi:hypothetical protein
MLERMTTSGQVVREYMVVYDCGRALVAAVIAVTVAVRDNRRPEA